MNHPWDYLILTAGNEQQATLYRDLLGVRAELGLLADFKSHRVVTDPDGKRVGSGGSTLFCLLEILNELGCASSPDAIQKRLSDFRILIVHAGGDSRRLPAYGPCGKVFIPLPCDSDSAVGTTLFDYQLPIYAAMPPMPAGRGQVVITSGDVLLGFNPQEVAWQPSGLTGLGCRAVPEHAARHGVYCADNGGQVRRFLQKPSVDVQRSAGAIDAYGETVLDIGVISFDADAAARLLTMCEVQLQPNGQFGLSPEMRSAVTSHGLDFYREICCALGTEHSLDGYITAVRSAGSKWPDHQLELIYQAASRIPAAVCVLRKCDFLHFGTTQEIRASGRHIAHQQQRLGRTESTLYINTQVNTDMGDRRADAWIEGCRIAAPLSMANRSTLVGVDVDVPLQLQERACLDVLPGRNRLGEKVDFVRCYFEDDPLHNTPAGAVVLCGQPLNQWLSRAQLIAENVWDADLPLEQRSAWNARLFPAVTRHADYRGWLWMLSADTAEDAEYRAWAKADRYSFEEMATLSDIQAFHARRMRTRAEEIQASLRRRFRGDSAFSASDLAHLLRRCDEPDTWLFALITEIVHHGQCSDTSDPHQAFAFARIVHSVGSALQSLTTTYGADADPNKSAQVWTDALQRLADRLTQDQATWLERFDLAIREDVTITAWVERAKQLAFEDMRGRIISSHVNEDSPRNALRPDEIVWGRAPARLDLGGGWTDTPPYALEHGGCVLNVAVELNGQPPIQAFARVIREPLIRIRSIDVGTQVELREWDELLNCSVASGEFSLVQAALAISGFQPASSGQFDVKSTCDSEVLVPSPRSSGERVRERGSSASASDICQGAPSLSSTLESFGGGLEITTLAAIPKGSGLGTSSIMGSVLLAVVNRVLGRHLSSNDLFHGVLRLEQKLTTGGGWQDQIGGSVGGLKLLTTQPALIPDATIRYVPADILDPKQNGGQTLLYYTGITRLAKNILQQVVGRYLDRDREAMRVLRRLHVIASEVAESLARKDIAEFGRLIDEVWRLNKQLDPDSSTAQIEAMLARVRPWIFGAKLLGAGGGGFLLLICRSIEDAAHVRTELDGNPPNNRARFFDFAVSQAGLSVSVC